MNLAWPDQSWSGPTWPDLAYLRSGQGPTWPNGRDATGPLPLYSCSKNARTCQSIKWDFSGAQEQFRPDVLPDATDSGVGVRLKVGINIEKTEGAGSGEGLCPPRLGSGACPHKKNNFCAKNYAILSKFWYFFPILHHKNLPAHQRKWGAGADYPQS